MSTKPSIIEYIEDQFAGIPEIRSHKMFGEYALEALRTLALLPIDNRS